MSDHAATISIMNGLSDRVDRLSRDVAVLIDRRSDGVAQDDRHAALQSRVEVLEREAIARAARARTVTAIVGALSAAGGAGVIKLLALIGG